MEILSVLERETLSRVNQFRLVKLAGTMKPLLSKILFSYLIGSKQCAKTYLICFFKLVTPFKKPLSFARAIIMLMPLPLK